MASPDDVLDGVILSIKDGIEEHDVLPEHTDFLKYEEDMLGEDANVSLPLVQLDQITVDYLNEWNTDRIGYMVNDQGQQVGRVYHNEYELSLEIDLWTAAQSRYDVNELGTALRRWLYRHDKGSAGVPLPFEMGEYYIEDDDGNQVRLDDVWDFRLVSAERADDITGSPTIRRWRYQIDIASFEAFGVEADDPPVEDTVLQEYKVI